MKNLKINLQNCYGIKSLKKDFDFSKCNTYVIYAPNGVMKTSFAKTFDDLSNGVDSKDLIFPSRETIREIKKDSDNDIAKEQVFVIEPYDKEDFNSEKISTLLVNKELKKLYDEIHIKIDDEKDRLLKELKFLSGLRIDIEKEISETFTSVDGKLFVSLARVEKEVFDNSESEFSDISYQEIFNDKVIKFLETKDFKRKLTEYIKKYDELIEASKYFKKGVFNHNNAAVIAKSLLDNGFFDAKHTISLNAEGNKNEIKTKEELEIVIEEEKNAILNDPILAKAFEEIDNKLKKNKELRDFRDYLLDNMKILPELENLASFKQKIWISYLKEQKDLYRKFLEEYQKGEKELEKIIDQAKKEETHWINVINIFNERFSVPFKLTIQNQGDVILKRDIPSIAFVFKDMDEEVPVEKPALLQALSSGEKRALYILNIIFEVQARKEENQETLFIVDDIADSFDYKNKYAIIEYLKDIFAEESFYQIILTHNFDFFRTIQSRFIPYKYCLFVEKTSSEIKIIDASYINNPFKNDWIKNLKDDKKLIASIPFVRNLIEYTKDSNDDDFIKLTSLLHIKSDSDSITKNDLEDIYKKVFPNMKLHLDDKGKKVSELIFELADECLTSNESINLENKILLSIAIRLKAEKFMFDKVSDKTEFDANQTGKLFQRFKDEFNSQSSELKNIKLLERVNLMTPENIHFNSFMYEPILDMSDEHLKKLYKEIRK